MESVVREIVKTVGGYRERDILSQPHTLCKGTWNAEHKVVEVIAKEMDYTGHRNAFSVDLVTNKICG